MLNTIENKTDLALLRLREHGVTAPAALECYGRVLGEALLALEISPATVLACVRAIRSRVETTQALHRPHPLESVRAVTLEVLQDVSETSALFHARITPPKDWTTPYTAVSAQAAHALTRLGTERRVVGRLAFHDFRRFESCASLRMNDSYQSMDREAFRRHLRQVGRRPEPPADDSRGMSYV